MCAVVDPRSQAKEASEELEKVKASEATAVAREESMAGKVASLKDQVDTLEQERDVLQSQQEQLQVRRPFTDSLVYPSCRVPYHAMPCCHACRGLFLSPWHALYFLTR